MDAKCVKEFFVLFSTIIVLILVVMTGSVASEETIRSNSEEVGIAIVDNITDFNVAMTQYDVELIIIKPNGEFNLETASGFNLSKSVMFSEGTNNPVVKMGDVRVADGVTVTISPVSNSKFVISDGKVLYLLKGSNFVINNKEFKISGDSSGLEGNKIENAGTIHLGESCDGMIGQYLVQKCNVGGTIVADADIVDDDGSVMIPKGTVFDTQHHKTTIDIPASDNPLVLMNNNDYLLSVAAENEVEVNGAGILRIVQCEPNNSMNIDGVLTVNTPMVISLEKGGLNINISAGGKMRFLSGLTTSSDGMVVIQVISDAVSELQGVFAYGGNSVLPSNVVIKNNDYVNNYYLRFDYEDKSGYITTKFNDAIAEVKSGVQYYVGGLTGSTDDTVKVTSKKLNVMIGDSGTPLEFEMVYYTGYSSKTPIWYIHGEEMKPDFTYSMKPEGETFQVKYSGASMVVFWYQEGIEKVLTPGNIYSTQDGQYQFMVPKTGTIILKGDKVPENTYKHYLDPTNSNSDEVVVVSRPKLSFKDISEDTLYRDQMNIHETTVQIRNNAGLDMDLAFVKKGLNTFVTTIPGVTVSGTNGEYKITASTVAELGTWEVYAHFKGLSSDAGDYAFDKVGNITIYQNESAESANVISMVPETIDDGGYTEIVLEGTEGRKVYLKYYDADSEQISDAVNMTTKSDKLRLVENQNGLSADGTYFTIPDSKKLSIAIKADTGVFKEKHYKILITVDGCRTDLPGGDKNPIVKELTVKGNGYTAKMERDVYVRGENMKVTGTYNDNSGNFGLSFYIEGTNVPMTKLHVPLLVEGNIQGSDVRNGEYYYYLSSTYSGDSFNYTMASWNPGIYKVYASLENLEGDRDGKNDYTVTEKTKILEKAVTLTVTLEDSAITILDAQKEAVAGFTSNGDSRYMTILVEAKNADAISLYIIGQNKMFYVNGDDALKYGYIKSLDSSSWNYLYADDENSLYWYNENGNTPATDKSLKKILNNLGKVDAFGMDDRNYPVFLIIDNQVGTFTIYVHFAGTDRNESITYKEETNADNRMDLGQYYLIVQNPMADQIFNTYATKADGFSGYSSGVDVFTNGKLKFNVPALVNIEAARALMDAIQLGGDLYAGMDFYVVPESDGELIWNAPKESYGQGEVITLGVSGSSDDVLMVTLELNQFDLNQTNINLIQSFIPEKSGNAAPYTWNFSLDTTGNPVGTYLIIVKNAKNEVIKTYPVKIVEGMVKPVTEDEKSTKPVIKGPDTVIVGESCSYTIDMTNRLNGDIAWKVSDDMLASIDKYGNYTAKSQGHVTITVTDNKTGETGNKVVTNVNANGGTSTDTSMAKSPFPILGVLAGAGIVCGMLIRRK